MLRGKLIFMQKLTGTKINSPIIALYRQKKQLQEDTHLGTYKERSVTY